MAGLVGIAVFDTGFFQCRSPDGFANRLVIFPRLVCAGVMEDAIILFVGECMLTEQGFPGLRLERDYPVSRFCFGAFQMAAHQ